MCRSLKKILPTIWRPGHSQVGFFNMPGQAQTQDLPFYGAFETPDPPGHALGFELQSKGNSTGLKPRLRTTVITTVPQR